MNDLAQFWVGLFVVALELLFQSSQCVFDRLKEGAVFGGGEDLISIRKAVFPG